jgi:ectoine hydroxylase-related dioxygenase (phytanoyl-CoA dioxygenase family)
MNLAAEQIQSYIDEGFLLLPDAIDAETVERARQVLEQKVVNAGENPYHTFVRDSAVSACFNRKVCDAAAQLANVRSNFKPPRTVYTVTAFPTTKPWELPSPHIDHAKEEDAHQTFPPPFRIGCLIYLSDVQSQGGATIVWPGSHRRLEEMAKSNVERYKYLASVHRDIGTIDLGSPREITARAGSALFYQYLCAHSGSSNSGTTPRFALNHKW